MIESIRGTRDILPEDMVRWRYLEQVAEEVFSRYGYRLLRTPLCEKTELFARAVGETTDIVEKEMYTFPDRGGESLTLRPEGTAGVVRAFIQHGKSRELPWKVYYVGPMFRYERPQKGRQRQFHQIGCELFGPEGPLADAEMMALVLRFLEQVGLGDKVVLEVNSLGCPQCRPGFRDVLLPALHARVGELCPLCVQRLERNPLRVLDCKNEACHAVALAAPRMLDHLCQGCQEHFQTLLGLLTTLALPHRVNPLMVRGLDYYTRTAFEATTTHLGAQNAVAAGGRYDGLVATMGGPATPAVGFAMGLERLALLLEERPWREPAPGVFVSAMGAAAEALGLRLAEALRGDGWAVELHLAGGSLKSQMKRAGRSEAPLTLVIGAQEVEQGRVLLKDMASGQQSEVALDEVVAAVRRHLQAR
ncbi:MAG: histidine--tRNA ligase [Magnetococcus sp. WYHC-3]